MARVEFEDKVAIRQSSLPEVNKITAQNINELKASINAIYDSGVPSQIVVDITSEQIQNAGTSLPVVLPALDFGKYYSGKVTMKFTAGETPYTVPEGETLVYAAIVSNTSISCVFSGQSIIDNYSSVTEVLTNSFSGVNENGVVGVFPFKLQDYENDILFGFAGENSPISLENGDGTIQLIFDIAVKDF